MRASFDSSSGSFPKPSPNSIARVGNIVDPDAIATSRSASRSMNAAMRDTNCPPAEKPARIHGSCAFPSRSRM